MDNENEILSNEDLALRLAAQAMRELEGKAICEQNLPTIHELGIAPETTCRMLCFLRHREPKKMRFNSPLPIRKFIVIAAILISLLVGSAIGICITLKIERHGEYATLHLPDGITAQEIEDWNGYYLLTELPENYILATYQDIPNHLKDDWG